MSLPFWQRRDARLGARLNFVIEATERVRRSNRPVPSNVEIDTSYIDRVSEPYEAGTHHEAAGEAAARDGMPAYSRGQLDAADYPDVDHELIDGEPADPYASCGIDELRELIRIYEDELIREGTARAEAESRCLETSEALAALEHQLAGGNASALTGSMPGLDAASRDEAWLDTKLQLEQDAARAELELSERIASLEAEVLREQASRREADAKRERARRASTDLQQQLTALKKATDQQSSAMHDEVAGLKETQAKLEAELQLGRSQVSDLQARLELQARDLEVSLEQQTSDLQARLDLSEKANATLEAHVAALELAASEHDTALAGETQSLQMRIAALEADLAQSKTAIGEVEARRVGALRAATDLQKEMAALRQETERRVAAEATETARLREEAAARTVEATQHGSALAEAQQGMAALREDLARACQEKEQLALRLAEETLALQNQVGSLDAELGDSRAAMAALGKSHGEAVNEAAELRQQLSALGHQSQQGAAEAETTTAALRDEIEKLAADAAAAHAALTGAEARAEQAQHRLAGLDEAMAGLAQERDGIRSELAAETDRQAARIAALEAELDQSRLAQREAEAQHAIATEGATRFEQQLLAMQEQGGQRNAEADAESEALHRRVEALEAELAHEKANALSAEVKRETALLAATELQKELAEHRADAARLELAAAGDDGALRERLALLEREGAAGKSEIEAARRAEAAAASTLAGLEKAFADLKADAEAKANAAAAEIAALQQQLDARDDRAGEEADVLAPEPAPAAELVTVAETSDPELEQPARSDEQPFEAEAEAEVPPTEATSPAQSGAEVELQPMSAITDEQPDIVEASSEAAQRSATPGRSPKDIAAGGKAQQAARESEAAKGRERRANQRVPSQMSASLSGGGIRSSIACILRDKSSSGAKLEFASDSYADRTSELSVGSQVTLAFFAARERTTVNCIVVWLGGGSCGVRFSGQFHSEMVAPRGHTSIRISANTEAAAKPKSGVAKLLGSKWGA